MDCLFVFLVVGAITSIILLGTGCHTISSILSPSLFLLGLRLPLHYRDDPSRRI
jgi:hypothetical protein